MLFLATTPALVALLALASSLVDGAVLRRESQAVSAVHRVRRAPKIVSCKGTGQYPLPISNVCKPCSFVYAGAATCSTTAALRCSTGLLSGGVCVKTCPAATFNLNTVCTKCSTRFTGAASCTAAAVIKCNTGFLSAGRCVTSCPAGFVNSPSTRTCVACSTYDSQALTCTGGKIATCSAGAYLNAAKNDCVPCTTVDKFATACTSASVVTTCSAPYRVSTNLKSCVLATAWSMYLSSIVPGVGFTSNVQSPVTCGRSALAMGNQLATYDPSTAACSTSVAASSATIQTLVWDDTSVVFIVGTCKVNNAIVPAAKARCHDATLTATACTLADRSACATLVAPCSGSQFRNYNGDCQECQTAYPGSRTCDLWNGATLCIDGDYLSNGQCTTCTTFDDNAAECAADGTLTACNDGWVLSNNVCVVDTSVPTSDDLDSAWSYYPDSFVVGGASLSTDAADQYECANTAFGDDVTLGAFDAEAGICYGVNSTTTLEGAIAAAEGNSVFLLGSCDSNAAAVSSDVAAQCIDITIDDDSCEMNGAPCS